MSIITRSDAGDPAAVHRAELAGENCVSVGDGSVCRECLRYLCANACDMCQICWVKLMVPEMCLTGCCGHGFVWKRDYL